MVVGIQKSCIFYPFSFLQFSTYFKIIFLNVIANSVLKIRLNLGQQHVNSNHQEPKNRPICSFFSHSVQSMHLTMQVKTNMKDLVDVRPSFGIVYSSPQ